MFQGKLLWNHDFEQQKDQRSVKPWRDSQKWCGDGHGHAVSTVDNQLQSSTVLQNWLCYFPWRRLQRLQGGTTRWKEILLVKEDPNVTVSKEQRREMRLVVEVSFQHGSQEGGKKKTRDERRGNKVQTAPLWREKARRQSCVVPLSSWSCLDLSPQEKTPRVPGRRNVIVPVGFQSFRDTMHFICTRLPNHPPKNT